MKANSQRNKKPLMIVPWVPCFAPKMATVGRTVHRIDEKRAFTPVHDVLRGARVFKP